MVEKWEELNLALIINRNTTYRIPKNPASPIRHAWEMVKRDHARFLALFQDSSRRRMSRPTWSSDMRCPKTVPGQAGGVLLPLHHRVQQQTELHIAAHG